MDSHRLFSILRFAGGGGILLALAGCSSVMFGGHSIGESATGSVIPPAVRQSAQGVCAEARAQLERLNGGGEVEIKRCGAQSAERGAFDWEVVFNDHTHWDRLIATNSTEEVLFIIPLALVAYGFAGSGESTDGFDDIRIRFDNESRTTYEFAAVELDRVLAEQAPERVEAEIRQLQFRMRITQR